MSTATVPPLETKPEIKEQQGPQLISKGVRARPLFDPEILRRATTESFLKLNPRHVAKNPVMFVVEVGAALTTLFAIKDAVTGAGGLFFGIQISLWLWFTVLFANFAEAMAEARGKAQADNLRKTKKDTVAKKITANGKFEMVPASKLRAGDVVVVEAGYLIPGDGEVIEGIASVDESVITGESAPVIRESGGDRSAVTGGTKVLSDHIKIKITSNPGETFLDRMIALVEGAVRQKTPNEIALNILIAGLTLIFLLAVATLPPYVKYAIQAAGSGYDATASSGANLGPTSAKLINGATKMDDKNNEVVAFDGISVRIVHYCLDNGIPYDSSVPLDMFKDAKGDLDDVKLIKAFTDEKAPLVFRPKSPIPADAVTASASGLDPHISRATADAQVSRIAQARSVTPEQIRSLIDSNTAGADLAFLGEPRVNVLMLNVALDEHFPKK